MTANDLARILAVLKETQSLDVRPTPEQLGGLKARAFSTSIAIELYLQRLQVKIAA